MTKVRQLTIVTLVLLLSTAIVFAADSQPVSRKALNDISDALAYDLGKVYQMGQNCGQELPSVSPQKAAGLFINYFNEKEVQAIMNNYGSGMESQRDKVCDSKELKAFMLVMMEKVSNYIKLATPHTRPHSER
jgi:hypothetical protein